MNYYEKLIQEKQNGNLFLERLKTKSFRSADELERTIKSYVAGGRVISDDADGFTVEAIEDDGKHTYKIYLREDGGTSERVTVEKVVKLNSKGETNMGYYADLIKEKQNFSVQDKFSYKGCLITILKKGESAYTYSITQDGREEGTNATYSTQDEAERKAKREVEVNWNEKEEKDNARDYDDINKVYKEAKRIVDDLRRKYREISGRERDDGNFLYSIIEEKGMPTESGDQQKAKHAAGLLESVRRMSTTPRDWGNSKEEKGYYAKLAEEKASRKH